MNVLRQVESPLNIHRSTEGKNQTWYFPSHDFTLMVMWTQFLVQATQRLTINGTATDVFDIHLDKINSEWTNQLPGINFAVIATGNWFIRKTYLHKDDKLLGCTLCSDAKDLGYVFAIKNALSTTLDFLLSGCKECEGMVTVLRTYTPSHFEHGSWFSGGNCNRTQPLSESEVMSLHGNAWRIRESQVEEFGKIVQRVEREEKMKKKNRFVLLDVSKAMMYRADAHPDSHWQRWQNVNDCLHWCLPGPVDLWSELLMVILRKHSRN
ncbi:putative PC-Esterase [Dioscorea sansibarensis]